MKWPAVAVVVSLLLVAGCAEDGPLGENDLPEAHHTPPPAAVVADYQLGGSYEPADDVEIVTRDRTDDPAEGVYSVCYVNAFQTQPDAGTWWETHHPALLLRDAEGAAVEDEGWPGEYLFDLSTQEQRLALAEIVGDWITQCADEGFDAVEPDNLDAFTRSGELLDQGDAEAFAKILILEAHAQGLAIAQKNTLEIDGRALGFDFAVAEECQVYDECDDYVRMYGERVIEIEYIDNGRDAFAQACAQAAGTRSILLRDRDVVSADDPAYVFEHC